MVPDTLIDIARCAQLRTVLWDRRDTVLPAVDVLHLYEDRWRYMNPEYMDEEERNLLDQLIRTLGKGVFLGR